MESGTVIDHDGVVVDLAELDSHRVLEALSETCQAERRAAAWKLQLAAHWADLHSGDALDDNSSALPGTERPTTIGGDGTPSIGEFAAADFAAVAGLSPSAGTRLIAAALDLRHRFPTTWDRVCRGEVETWICCKITIDTRYLSLEAARRVDAAIAPFLTSLPPGRLFTLVEAKALEADPAAAKARAQLAQADRYVRRGRSNVLGVMAVSARGLAGDVLQFTAACDKVASILAWKGDPDSADIRRSKALGYLGNPLRHAQLLAEYQGRDKRQDVDRDGLINDQSGDGQVDEDRPGQGGQECAQPARAGGRDRRDGGMEGPARGGQNLGERPAPSLNQGDHDAPGPMGGDHVAAGRHRSGWNPPVGPHQDQDRAGLEGTGAEVNRFAGEIDDVDEPMLIFESDLHPADHELSEPLPNLGAPCPQPSLDDQLIVDYAGELQAMFERHRVSPRELLPKTTVYLHLDRDTLMSGSGVVRGEGIGPITPDQFTHWIRGTSLTVTPVLDPNNTPAVDGYEASDRLKDALRMINPAEVFPYGTNTSRDVDHDHAIPYRPPPDGPPGQTSIENVNRLGRRAHRLKTHGGWQVRIPEPGTTLWRNRYGWHFLTNPAGTHPLGNGAYARDLWRAADKSITADLYPPPGDATIQLVG